MRTPRRPARSVRAPSGYRMTVLARALLELAEALGHELKEADAIKAISLKVGLGERGPDAT